MQRKQSKNFLEMFTYSPRQILCKSPSKGIQQFNNNQHFQNTNKMVAQTKKQRRITYIESSTDCLEDLIEIYEWRKETQYPIISSNWRKVIFSHFTLEYKNKKQLTTFLQSNSYSQTVTIEVETQFVNPLQYYKPLTLAHWLYAFKESIIAFQRLYSLFGSYSVTSKMITINQQGKLKVWLSPSYDQNIKIDEQTPIKQYEGQIHIVGCLKSIFGRFSQDSHTFRDFLSLVENVNTFIGLLRLIEEFSLTRKIIIAKRIIKRLQMNIKRPQSPIVNLKPLRPLTRAPKFITPPSFNRIGTLYQLNLPLIARKSVKYQKSQFDAQTNQTLSPQSSSKIFHDKNSCNTFGAKYGKIVKNRMNIWLQNAKSMKNLPTISPQIKDRLEPNSVQKNINRLFDEDFVAVTKQTKQQKNLMNLGRSVRQSITF